MPVTNANTVAARNGAKLRRLPVQRLINKQRDIRIPKVPAYVPNQYFSMPMYLRIKTVVAYRLRLWPWANEPRAGGACVDRPIEIAHKQNWTTAGDIWAKSE